MKKRRMEPLSKVTKQKSRPRLEPKRINPPVVGLKKMSRKKKKTI